MTGVWWQARKSADGRYFLPAGGNRVSRVGAPSGFTSIEGARAALQQAASSAVYEPGMVFYVRKEDYPALAALRQRKRRVTVGGVCRGGQRRPDLVPDYVVTVEECEIVGGRR